jgi:D-alanyl-D-alanine carboxypeptidase/D-alanyl-D-alanine-endopeptidase (penicillin-binding protein 4)
MKRIKLFMIVVLIATLSPLTFSANTASLSVAINNELKIFDKSANIGIFIKDKKTGKTLYSLNADQNFMPASNEKLLTAFAALQYLGPEFVYKTQIFVDGSKIKNGILHDNIYLEFSGDPTLTMEMLDHLVIALSQAGIQHVNGNIIIDDTAFDQVGMSPGSSWDDKDFCWGAPINAIIVDNNCVYASLMPASKPAQPAKLVLPDNPQSMQFLNHVATAEDGTTCFAKTRRMDASTYTINGCIAIAAPTVKIAMAIDNPRTNLQMSLSYLFNKNQITTSNHYEFKKALSLPTVLASESSLPLTALVVTMLKESNNTIANTLFKTMGARFSGEPGSFENGSAAVRDILANTLHVEIPKTTLIDGCGASRYDFLTPHQIVTILQNISATPYAALFKSALPVSGVDGTLKARMKDSSAYQKIFAKTGTATAISSLSGYAETKHQNTLIFSIMINGFVDLPLKYQSLQDRLCALMVERG